MSSTASENLTLRIAGTVDDSVVDGPGFRLTVFTQGCPHGCPGCHNPQTHDFAGGSDTTVGELFEKYSANSLTHGVTLSGGEPFSQARPLARLARLVRESGGDVVTYSGWTLEELRAMDDPDVSALLSETDVLIDGRYVESERDLTLQFRGSRNQRLLKKGSDGEFHEVAEI